jgi:hypothetical protein
MARTLHTDTYNALSANSTNIAHLISIEVDTDTPTVRYYTSNPIDLVYDSQTYLSSELLVDISTSSQSGTLQNQQFNITLSNATGSFVSDLLADNWNNGDVYYYFCAIDSSYAILGSPILLFKGLLSSFTFQEGDKGVITLTADSHWADFEKKGGRRTNSSSQRELHPTDLGFEFSANSVKDLKWGKA